MIEMIGEPRKLLLKVIIASVKVLQACSHVAKLSGERINIGPNITNISIHSLKLLHDGLMVLLIVGGVETSHTRLKTLLNCI